MVNEQISVSPSGVQSLAEAVTSPDVLSTGCAVPPGATIENLDAFYKTLDIYNMTQAIRTKWLFDR